MAVDAGVDLVELVPDAEPPAFDELRQVSL